MMFHVVNVVHAFESIPSYQESVNQFLVEKSKASKSPFSKKDKAIMEKPVNPWPVVCLIRVLRLVKRLRILF